MITPMREFRQDDLVWLRPIAEKYDSWENVQRIANDPEGYGLLAAMVIAPFALGAIFYDEHGAVGEGLCDDYGIKQFMRLGRFFCQMADELKIDLHNHEGQKAWQQKALKRLGFTFSGTKFDYVRYAPSLTEAKEIT
jgi:hypothetical protein